MDCCSETLTSVAQNSGGKPAGVYLSDKEPSLCDLVNDPMTHRLMASDRVGREHLMALLNKAGAALGNRKKS